MQRIPVVVIGAGQAGLAVSHLLSRDGIDHVVLERGQTAQRWRSHSWQSLRLLTPNWLSRLPGWHWQGPDPDGYMTAAQVVDYLDAYATASDAPVVTGADVLSVRRCGSAYRVVSTAGTWTAAAVVVATGFCDLPHVPGIATALADDVTQLTPSAYRSPDDLPAGGVLVVGASASGVQLADEIVRSGRDVVLAVGSHSRLPRTYRGMDILWWLDAMGVLDRPFAADADPQRARTEPSPQLVGRPDRRDVDLRSLQDRGVRLAGRVKGAAATRVRFADDLPDSVDRADERLRGVLKRMDAFAFASGLDPEVDSAAPVRNVDVRGRPTQLELGRSGIRTVLWATGYRRHHPWLHVPVTDAAGEIRHTAGVTPAPGLYVVGMRGQSRRSSATLDGVRHDAAAVVHGVRAGLEAVARGRSAA